MRIITGKARGTKLNTLSGEATRPTAERTKEAVFSMLQNEIAGARVLDLFAGSGQLGLEALSRGAEYAVFNDSSREAAAIIRANVEKTHFADACEVLSTDWQAALRRLAGRERFELSFLDPPYAGGFLPKVLAKMLEWDLLTEGGIIVCESADEGDVFGGNEELKNQFIIRRVARYGAACVTVLEKGGE
ncbi:MAG: 16S rRNA (guanine(966)-N(2))-methyltransferase RsmD [Clostridia bacterium]|nr:16S rRNA (guanine(966)-N(2))-methyltransferase RsmD [Clostridia bacterium]